jgi:tyrosyl-tRNA synthetase
VFRCEEASAALFSEEIDGLSEDLLLAVTEDAPTTEVGRAELLDGSLGLVDLLTRTGLAKSRSDARRAIEAGGTYVNNVKQSDVARTLGQPDLLHDRYVVLRRGPRNVHIVRVT